MSAGDASAPRLGGIDCLRGVAALAVFFFHLSATPNHGRGALLDAWNAIWRHGHLGVPLFFVISGVCITRTWLRSEGAASFVRQRLRRIFPAYWGSLAVIVLLAFAVKSATGTNDVAPLPRSPAAIAATLTLTTSPVTSVPTMSWVYWSLSTELAFYAVMALLILSGGGARARALAIAHGLLCVTACWPGWSRVPGFFFVELWPLFGVGAALAIWKTDRRLAGFMLAAAAVHALACAVQGRLIAYWITAAAGTAACAWMLSGGVRLWPRAFTILGEMSYSVYLLHTSLGVYLIHRLMPSFGAHPLLEIARQLAVVLLTLIAIRPFYLWLERPFVRNSATSITPALQHAAP